MSQLCIVRCFCVSHCHHAHRLRDDNKAPIIKPFCSFEIVPNFEITKDFFKIEIIDIRRAYYHANAIREIYIDLPEGDEEEGMCGILNKSLQGTRDAAQNWEYAYVEAMEEIGFKRGMATPCAFYMAERNLRVVVHGDDFTVLGQEADLDWFRGK